MIGMCQREQGNPTEAIHQFKQGLHANGSERERLSLYYEIGVTYEQIGDHGEALYYFEAVLKRDPSFADAAHRAGTLRGRAATACPPTTTCSRHTREAAFTVGRGIRGVSGGPSLALPVACACRLCRCVALGGCSIFMHSIERPTAQVRDASVTAAGFGGVSGSLRLDVTNPNTFGVPLSGIDWQLAIGGNRAATGKSSCSRRSLRAASRR